MSLLDELIAGFSSAMDDIRHNVVENGWFGQETSGDISDKAGVEATDITAPDIEAPKSLDSIMEMFTPPPAETEQEKRQEQGIDI